MNILLALDGTPGTEELIGEALAQPWPKGTKFDVLHVVESNEDAECIERTLTAAVFSINERGWAADRHMRVGHAKAQILEYAERHRPDLILVGTHRRANLTRFVLGSVSAAIVRHAPCSVGILRPKPHDFRAERTCRLMLATDGSQQALKAAQAIASRPWKAGTEVMIISVIEMIEPPTLSLVGPKDAEFPLRPEEFEAARQNAEKAVCEASRIIAPVCPSISRCTPVVNSGAKAAILEESRHWDADCIFVGAHGVKGLDRFLLGSVSEALAVHAHCSVMVIR